MPTVLRIGAWRFFFYSNERNEPPHVHVEGGSGSAKLWLRPVHLARSSGLAAHELSELRRLAERHHRTLLKAWDDYFEE